jgi:hypothetical protein
VMDERCEDIVDVAVHVFSNDGNQILLAEAPDENSPRFPTNLANAIQFNQVLGHIEP